MEQTDNTNKKTFITYLEITLVVLFLITLGYFIFNKNNNNVDTHKNQIDSLNTDISKLNKKIDSIKLLKTKLTFSIDSINKKVSDNEYELFKTKNELDNLKKQKNEKHTYINDLSANGLANDFSKYLDSKSKGSN